MIDDDNPLQVWFRRQKSLGGEGKVEFARRLSLSTGTLYAILNGERKDFLVSTLQRIEEGTRGRITVRALTHWLEKHAERKEA